MKTGHIFFIMGVSGSGKGTLIKNLQTQKIKNLHIPPSYKTRDMRPWEVNGKDAHFVSVENFLQSIETEEFLEYAILYEGNDYYGTKYEDVLKNGIHKWYTVLKEIDINGLKRLQKEHPELRPNYTTIFLDIPSHILEERILSRWENMNKEELQRRIETATKESEVSEELCDYLIDATQSPEEVLEEVLAIIEFTWNSTL